MIINGRSVRGLYLYSENETFGRGDFVVKGDKLYRCKVTVRDKDPDLDYNETYYVPYLSEDTISVDEFKAYLSGEEDFGDKFISLNSLSFILGSYMSGFDEKGLISNSIIEDDDVYKIIAENYFDGNETYLNPLDTILTSGPNNGIFTVAKDIVQDIIGLVPEDSDDIMLLRQYTYSNSTDNYLTRIQELIDVTTGTVKYRYANSTNNFEPSVNWLDVSINPEFKKIVDEVINHYQNLINDLKSTKISLLSNFRFKSIPVDINCSSRIIQFSGNDAEIVFDSTEDILELTITLEKSSSNIVTSDSITVCIRSFDETTIAYSVFNGSATLNVTGYNNRAQVEITKVDPQDSNSYIISSIYYKNVYKNTLGISSGEKSNYLIKTDVEQSTNSDGNIIITDPEKGLLGVTVELKSFAWTKDEWNSDGANNYAMFVETGSVSGKIMVDLDELPKDREIILSYYNYLKKEEDNPNDYSTSYPPKTEISKLRIWVWRNSSNNTITIGTADKNPDIDNKTDIVGTVNISPSAGARTIEGYSLQYYLDNYDYKQKIKKITYYG